MTLSIDRIEVDRKPLLPRNEYKDNNVFMYWKCKENKEPSFLRDEKDGNYREKEPRRQKDSRTTIIK